MEGWDKRRLLVLSDMHLGRDCNAITGFRHTRPDADFDQSFIDLLDYYTLGKEKDWRLVVAGDFIDFVEVVVVPGKQGKLRWSFQVTEEEREYGLGSEAERVLVKLDMTFSYHQKLFERLAQYIMAGGHFVVLRGNHDAEFHWKKVQRVFRRNLAEMAFSGQNLDLDELIEARGAFQENIRFAPWFYTEKNRVYIEHGHQYDPYCSFDHQLYPLSPTNPRRIDTPTFAFAMRYFVNLLSDFAAHNADMWTTQDYLNWLRQKGPAGLFYTVKMALVTVFRLFKYAYLVAFGRVRRYGKEHNKKLLEEANLYEVPVEKLKKVDSLHHTPVNRNIPELMRLLFLDRALLVLGCFFTIGLVFGVFASPWFETVGIVLAIGAAYIANRKMKPRRFFLPGPKQADVAKKIASQMEVPLVVMGHSHVAKRLDIGAGRTYVNTGCWLPPLEEKAHEECVCSLSHLVVEDSEPELRVFCEIEKVPRPAKDKSEQAKLQSGPPQDAGPLEIPDLTQSN